MTGQELHEFFKRHCVAHNVAYPRWEPRYEPVWSDLANELTEMGVGIVADGERMHMHVSELVSRQEDAHTKGYQEGYEASALDANAVTAALASHGTPLEQAAALDHIPHEPLRDLMKEQGARPVEPHWLKFWTRWYRGDAP